MNVLNVLHASYVQTRRIEGLARHLTRIIPQNSSVLDVGCGDGRLACRIMQSRMDLSFSGIDVLIREQTWIPVMQFDGLEIPTGAASVDVVMLIDVLHHADEPYLLLCEAVRVARKCIIVKDHLVNGFLAEPTLRFMDWIGNARYGVALPGNYWELNQWKTAFETLALSPVDWQGKLALYPKALDLLFGRSLHFLAKLDIREVSYSSR